MKSRKYPERFLFMLICFAFLYTDRLFAQTIITIKAGEDFTAVYKEIYRYPQFINGRVYFANGDSAKGKLNYNMLVEKIQFIDPKGDTFFLPDETPARFVTIASDTFYYNNKEYFELVADFHVTKLVIKRQIKLLDEQKIGAYGLPTSTQSIDNKNSLIANADHHLQLSKDIIFKKEVLYYFGNGDRNFIPVSKRNLLKEFPKQKTVVENYLEENNIDLKTEVDLKKLFVFLTKS